MNIETIINTYRMHFKSKLQKEEMRCLCFASEQDLCLRRRNYERAKIYDARIDLSKEKIEFLKDIIRSYNKITNQINVHNNI